MKQAPILTATVPIPLGSIRLFSLFARDGARLCEGIQWCDGAVAARWRSATDDGRGVTEHYNSLAAFSDAKGRPGMVLVWRQP